MPCSTIANETTEGQFPVLESLMKRQHRLVAPLAQLLVESGLKLTPAGFVLLTLLGIGAGIAIGWWMSRLAVSIILAVLFGVLPLIYVRRERNVRLQKFEEQFPEAIELIARAMRAGHAFTTGIKIAAEELPEPAGPEFRLLYERQNYGAQIPDALRAFAERVPTIDARFYSEPVPALA